MFRDEFLNTLEKYVPDDGRREIMWAEIQKAYSKSDRHYHNLNHLNALFDGLTEHQAKFNSWNSVVFAIAYHDFVYNTLKKENEEKSAVAAEKRLIAISFPEPEKNICLKFILATKRHERTDPETDLFTDADLSILGSSPEVYKTYCQQIRSEYSIYPDVLYNPGRKKVLIHFLKWIVSTKRSTLLINSR